MKIKKPPPPPEPTPTSDFPWALIFEDLFDTPVPLGSFPAAVANRWAAYPYPWSTLGGYYYPEKVIEISGGRMRWKLHQDPATGRWLMAAPYPRINGPAPASTGQLYGRYEMRWRADRLTGYYLVPLLWPESGVWPRDGEINWPEGNLDGTMHGFVHRQGATSGGDQAYFDAAVPMASDLLRTTVCEWRPGDVRLFLDGRLVGRTTERIPNTRMRWILQATTSPRGLPPAGTAGLIEAESVRVWKYAP